MWCIDMFELPLFSDGGIKSGLWLVLMDDTHTSSRAHWVQSANVIKGVFSESGQLVINHTLKRWERVKGLSCFVSYVVWWTFVFCEDALPFDSFDQTGRCLGNVSGNLQFHLTSSTIEQFQWSEQTDRNSLRNNWEKKPYKQEMYASPASKGDTYIPFSSVFSSQRDG